MKYIVAMLDGAIHRITKQGLKIKNDLRSHGSNKSSLCIN